jgi:hypothetical protein
MGLPQVDGALETSNLLRKHVTGEITIGAYQISPDDQVT